MGLKNKHYTFSESEARSRIEQDASKPGATSGRTAINTIPLLPLLQTTGKLCSLFLGGGAGAEAMISCQSVLIRRNSRNLSESRIRATIATIVPQDAVVVNIRCGKDKLHLKTLALLGQPENGTNNISGYKNCTPYCSDKGAVLAGGGGGST